MTFHPVDRGIGRLGRTGPVWAALCVSALLGCDISEAAPIEDLGPALAQAAAGRPVEARLTGGFDHTPCARGLRMELDLIPDARCYVSPDPGSAAFRRLSGVTNRIRELPEGPEGEHLRGLASLVWHQVSAVTLQRAVLSLSAAANDLEDAAILSDLGAAYLARAQAADDAVDLIRALDATYRALQVDPLLLEARFNLALILEAFHLLPEASRAWSAYLDLDIDSPWAEEASARAHDVRERMKRVRASDGRVLMNEALAKGNFGRVAELTRSHPRDARRWAMEEAIPAWAESVGDPGNPPGPSRHLQAAKSVGEALAADGRDASVLLALEAVERKRRAAHAPHSMKLLARAHVEYAEGRRRFDSLQVTTAAATLLSAAELFERSGSAAALWARYWLGGARLYQGRYDDAQAEFERILKADNLSALPALEGRARWGLALVQGRRGGLGRSLDEFEKASDAFERAAEAPNRAAVDALLAENRKLLGLPAEAWTSRYRALDALSLIPPSRRSANLLWEAGDAAARLGYPGAALSLHDAGVEMAASLGVPPALAEALVKRGRTRLGVQDREGALDDFRRALDIGLSIDDSALRAGYVARTQRAMADALIATDPVRSVALLDSVIAVRRSDQNRLAEVRASTSRARAYRALGKADRAREDLERVVGLLEEQAAALDTNDLQVAFAETAQEAFDEMIALQMDEHGDPLEALAYSERARRLLATRTDGGLDWIRRAAQGLELASVEADRAVIEYAVVGEDVFVWVVTREGVTSTRLLESATEVVRLVDRYRLALRALPPEIDRRASELAEILFPPDVRKPAGSGSWVIVPDKFLNGIPFAALRSTADGRYLVEERAVSVAPSAALYLALAARSGRSEVPPRPNAALLVGNPEFDRSAFPDLRPLEGAEREIEILNDVYPEHLEVLGGRATPARVIREMTRFPVVHYAGHAVYNPDRPGASYLVLAGSTERTDGRLRTSDLAGITAPNLRLVVLSACSSVAPASNRSGGFWGLAHPFLSAGASAVLGTLWEVDDEAAVELVTAFHRFWREGRPADEALRQAQLSLLRSGDPTLSSPYSWGAFQLIGTAD